MGQVISSAGVVPLHNEVWLGPVNFKCGMARCSVKVTVLIPGTRFHVCLMMFCNRLEDYDHNFNFGQSTEVQREYSMDLPSILTYKDLNANSVMLKLTSSAVDSYLAAFDKKLEKISVDLYKDGFTIL